MTDDRTQQNHLLAAMMAKAGVSNKGLARRVRMLSAGDGGELVHPDHVAVRRWLDGVIRQPQPRTCRLIARALSEQLGRPVALADIGYGHLVTTDSDTAISYPVGVSDSINVLCSLVDGQASNSTFIVVPEAWGSVLVRWFVDSDEPSPPPTGRRTITDVDIEAAHEATLMFENFDYRFGGGRPKPLVAKYLESEVLPLIRHSDLGNSVGKRYLSEVALLARLAGWTAYDTGAHGLAQRYFTQAFRLAKASGDRALCGRILAGMSHQANFLGHYQYAVDLALAAQRGISNHATPTAMALFCAMEARGRASIGDEKGVTAALLSAERWHARGLPENDPSWVRHFDGAELHAEFAHCFRDLGLPDLANTHAIASIRESSKIYVRSLSFCRTVLATSYLLSNELHQALTVAREVIDAAAKLKSSRVRSYLADFQQRLKPYAGEAQVRNFCEYMVNVFR
ncbi:MAG: hypothetical protein ACRDTC_20020 [Pseudonocardiaceae bacterium]